MITAVVHLFLGFIVFGGLSKVETIYYLKGTTKMSILQVP